MTWRAALDKLRRRKPARADVATYRPLEVAVAKLGDGAAVWIGLDEERELVITLPRKSAVQLVDRLLDVLGLEAS